MSLKHWVAWPAVPLALASAALFGASTPLAKALLGGGVSPWLLAGLLYLGSGMGLALITTARRLGGKPSSEAPLRPGDWKWMLLVVLSGGVVGPVLLMLGLVSTTARSDERRVGTGCVRTVDSWWLAS